MGPAVHPNLDAALLKRNSEEAMVNWLPRSVLKAAGFAGCKTFFYSCYLPHRTENAPDESTKHCFVNTFEVRFNIGGVSSLLHNPP